MYEMDFNLIIKNLLKQVKDKEEKAILIDNNGPLFYYDSGQNKQIEVNEEQSDDIEDFG